MLDLAPSQKRNPWGAIIILCSLAFVVVFYGLAYATWDLHTKWGSFHQHINILLRIDEFVYPTSTYEFTLFDKMELYMREYIFAQNLEPHFILHFGTPVFVAALISYLLFKQLYQAGGAETYRHIEGGRLHKARNAIKYGKVILKEEILGDFAKWLWFIPLSLVRFFKRQDIGVFLHHKVQVSLKKESEHLMVLGMPGAGKTRIIAQIVKQMIARGDLLFFYDKKPEFIELFWRKDKDAIISCFDKRGVMWNISADVRNQAECEEIAASMIPLPSKGETQWAQGARSIFVGILLASINNFDRKWSWDTIKNYKNLSSRQLHKLIEEHYPMAASYCNPESKSTPSYIATLQANLNFIEYLGVAWKAAYKYKSSVSVVKWIKGQTKYQCIYIQDHPRLDFIAAPLCNAIFTLCGNVVLTLSNREKKRRGFILDEFYSMPRNDNIIKFLSLFRSKGGFILIGVQDTIMIAEKYGRETLDAIKSIIGNVIIGKVAKAGGTAQTLSDDMGERIVERPQGYQQNGKINWQKETVPVVLPDEISGLPKAGVAGIYGYLSCGGDIMKLKWSVASHIKPINEAMIERSWVSAPISEKLAKRVNSVNSKFANIMAKAVSKNKQSTKTKTENSEKTVHNEVDKVSKSNNDEATNADERAGSEIVEEMATAIDPAGGLISTALELNDIASDVAGRNSDSTYTQSQKISSRTNKVKKKSHEHEM